MFARNLLFRLGYRKRMEICLGLGEGGGLAEIEEVYGRMVKQTRGSVVYCADDVNASRVCGAHSGAVSYGESAGATYRFDALHLKDFQSHFRVLKRGEPLGAAVLNIPGRHNVLNALAVIAVADIIGVPFDRIASALETFRGARRRFEIRHRSERVMIVDDYGHHPTEVRATLTAAANTGRSRVLALFQPHRFTRTAALAICKEFAFSAGLPETDGDLSGAGGGRGSGNRPQNFHKL